MQIKRFEAADMTDALRMIKREFGDDAVILSAKEIRPGGFFSRLKKKHVIITAAIDYQVKSPPASGSFPDLLSHQLDEDTPADRVSLSETPVSGSGGKEEELASTERPQEASPFSQGSTRQRPETKPYPERGRVISTISALRRYGARQTASDNHPKMDAASPERATPSPIVAPFYRHGTLPCRIALVGPSGAGKSSTVAKLARHCQMVEKKRTGLITLDRYRMGANSLLEHVGRIMNMPVEMVRDPSGLALALEKLARCDILLIDTPGMGRRDTAMMADVGRTLTSADPDEIHLVVNATVRREVLSATIDRFRPLGINRLLLTHLDEGGSFQEIVDDLNPSNLPVSFCGTGVDLFDGLTESAAAAFSSGFRTVVGEDAQQLPDRSPLAAADAEPHQLPVNLARAKFVANRNSELFHHPSCKSVKRINLENITAFNSIEQAIDEGFKPCRACCNVAINTKPAFHAFGYQRASAL